MDWWFSITSENDQCQTPVFFRIFSNMGVLHQTFDIEAEDKDLLLRRGRVRFSQT